MWRGPPFFQVATHALHLDVESALAQALLEFSIFLCRPDSQHTLHLKSRAGGGYSPGVIEAGVVRGGKCGRAVVHVQQHDVKLAGT